MKILAAIYQIIVIERDGCCVQAPNLFLPPPSGVGCHEKKCQSLKKKRAETHPSPPYYHNEENTLSGP